MGKRSNFPRRERDFYRTPPSAVAPLIGHLPPGATFAEPCVGDGALVGTLERYGLHCNWISDIEPGRGGLDARALTMHEMRRCDWIITNPPWPQPGGRGEPTTSIAEHLASLRPTWLLLAADFAHNSYFGRLASMCVKIVSIGRVSWEQNGVSGKDNAAWYLFDVDHIGQTRFYGRKG